MIITQITRKEPQYQGNVVPELHTWTRFNQTESRPKPNPTLSKTSQHMQYRLYTPEIREAEIVHLKGFDKGPLPDIKEKLLKYCHKEFRK